MSVQSVALPFEWVGGDLCLDFHNTVTWRRDGRLEHERLDTFSALVGWAKEAGIVARPEAHVAFGEQRPEAAGRALAGAHELRGVLHGVFAALARGEQAGSEALAAFNRHLSRALEHAEVAHTRGAGDGYEWSWTGVEHEPEGPLWPVAWSAARLLTAPPAPVRACANDECGWLFVDRSRRGNRRWCDMRECGSRAKARRHYRRKRAGGGPLRAGDHVPPDRF